MKKAFWIGGLLLALPASAADVDTIYLDEAVIEGNQELPRVLYILPWQEQPGEPVSARPPTLSPVDWMQPIYPDEHRRALRLRQILDTSPSNTESQGE